MKMPALILSIAALAAGCSTQGTMKPIPLVPAVSKTQASDLKEHQINIARLWQHYFNSNQVGSIILTMMDGPDLRVLTVFMVQKTDRNQVVAIEEIINAGPDLFPSIVIADTPEHAREIEQEIVSETQSSPTFILNDVTDESEKGIYMSVNQPIPQDQGDENEIH